MANINVGRKSGFIRRNGVMRRETLWLATSQIQAAIATADTAVQLFVFSSAFLSASVPFTIVRSRGLIFMHSDQGSATEDQEIAFGIAVVSDQANSIGVTAVPTPVADAGSDLWFVYETLFSQIRVTSAIGFSESLGRERIIDSKAMRKVEDGQNISAVVETGPNSEGVATSTFMRFLIKMH